MATMADMLNRRFLGALHLDELERSFGPRA
jgi:hypothetical protein